MRRKTSTTVIMYAVLAFFFIIWIFPIYTAITKSLQVGGWNSYLSVISNEDVHYFRVVFNSFFISVATAAIVVLITSLAGFAFAKMKFAGSRVLYVLLLACMAVPIASVTMPLFFTIKTFHLTNTYLGIIIPLVAFNALQMLLLWKNYFDGIPDEIIEAARVDGCSTLRIYGRILMPLSTPMIATTGVLTFVYSWNEYLIPLLLIRDESKYTVTLASTYFMETRSQTPEMVAQEYAALILMTIPSIIVYLISQKWLQAGITSGAVKS
ncbi:sugar ABC transporter permease [Bifidobacterium lemurum]|uniref:Sugar ABC transporter permease n=1 Tax=Bifidobacterium lemurum TaxID=1603886 RepID=A0A261FV44_9BIFI|nr:carbohydrate ABC transporter permease [Bifidobacterium lemurum]OZG63050.1 sugar ABC transporter permease [Bifidobacterium lemurum]QOL33384.1 carbohydrate ABC transporter permease [Bifidobacterium lemurum]